MTNPRYVENMIATAVVNRNYTIGTGFKLVFLDRKIQCIARFRTEPEAFFICNITQEQVDKGFSNAEWRTMTAKAISFMKEFGI